MPRTDRKPRLLLYVRKGPRAEENPNWDYRDHSGIYDAYLTLKNTYPEASKYLLYAYTMKENGDVVMEGYEDTESSD